jgi:predicted transcriptional regulator of viral defense system
MAPATRTISTTDRAVLDALARAGLGYVRLPNEADVLRRALPPGESPRRRLSDMAKRGQLGRIAHGVYVVLPPGTRTVRQAADLTTLVSAAFDGRWPYYVGFLSAIAEHGLTDESVADLHVAIGAARVPRLAELAGTRVHLARIAPDDDSGGAQWLGVERRRLRGKMFYVRSSPERTLVDALARPDLCGRPELWVRAWERAFREHALDLPLLLELARRRSRAVSARAALLLRELGRPREARLLLSGPVTGMVLFDASNPGRSGASGWRRDRETGLVLNVPADAIAGWLEYGK